MIRHQVLGGFTLVLSLAATGCGTIAIDGFQTDDAGTGATDPVTNGADGYKALVMRQPGLVTGEQIAFYFNNVPQTCDHPAVLPSVNASVVSEVCAEQAIYDFVYYVPFSFLAPEDGGSSSGPTSCWANQETKGCGSNGGPTSTGQCPANLELLGRDDATIHVRLGGTGEAYRDLGFTLDGEYDAHICGSLSD